MGTRDDAVVRTVTGAETPPGRDRTYSYGPWVRRERRYAYRRRDGRRLLHRRGWQTERTYVENLGLDPAEVVVLVVATHWHDDPIRGMERLVEACDRADFCCSAALCCEEFLSVVGALEDRSFSGFGVRELHGVLPRLRRASSRPTFALANQRVLMRNEYEIWSLSPGVFQDFLKSGGGLVPGAGQTKVRLPGQRPTRWRSRSRSRTLRHCLGRIWRSRAGRPFCRARRALPKGRRRSRFSITGLRVLTNRRYGRECWRRLRSPCLRLDVEVVMPFRARRTHDVFFHAHGKPTRPRKAVRACAGVWQSSVASGRLASGLKGW